MNIPTEHDIDIRAERPEMYEPPILDEIGTFTALTRLSRMGKHADADGYYDL
jgi:hypothetical protein